MSACWPRTRPSSVARAADSPPRDRAPAAAVRSLVRHALGPERVPDAALAPRRPRRLPETPALEEVESAVDRAGRDADPLALRNAACSSSPTPAASGRQSWWRSTSPTSTSTVSASTCAARVARSGSCRSGKRRRGGSASGSATAGRRSCAAPPMRSSSPCAAAGSTQRPAPAPPPPASPASRVRDAPARRRRRSPDDPGAPRPRLALDDADLQSRRRTAAAAVYDHAHPRS